MTAWRRRFRLSTSIRVEWRPRQSSRLSLVSLQGAQLRLQLPVLLGPIVDLDDIALAPRRHMFRVARLPRMDLLHVYVTNYSCKSVFYFRVLVLVYYCGQWPSLMRK